MNSNKLNTCHTIFQKNVYNKRAISKVIYNIPNITEFIGKEGPPFQQHPDV
jgi:hypothetical protein